MDLKLVVSLLAIIGGVFSQCNDKIHIVGAGDINGTANGVYLKQNVSCDDRDVFRHTDNSVYLYHIGGDPDGYWMVRVDLNCKDNNTDNGLVRAQGADVNPGDVQNSWEDYNGNKWNVNQEISVTCYEVPSCRHQIIGATNQTLNGYYDVIDGGSTECSSRDMYKHENVEAYLYFVYSSTQKTYYWVVGASPCNDVIDNGAYLQNEDYTVSPLTIDSVWMELDGNLYVPNDNITIDCIGFEDSGLSGGAIAGITIGCAAAVGGIAGGVGYYIKRKS